VTTGTWYIIFNQKTSLTNLNPNLDMLANIDVFGKPVPTIRFMGGREYDNLMKVFKITKNTKVLKNKKEIGTTLGATNLFNIKKKNKLQTVDIPKYQNQSMKSSYKLWEEDLYKKELFSHS